MRPMFLRLSFAIIAASCLCPPCLHAGGPISWHQLNFRDTQGKPILAEPAKWTVLCFLGTECPLARLYGPRLQSLADRYADRGVSFLGVNSNVQDSPAEIDAYARRHSIKFKIAKDSDQSIADAVGATRTPEVVVIDSGGLIRYQGRIDDQYEPGIARAKPTRNDLRDAIESLLAGNPIGEPKTTGVGCLITRVSRANTVGASKAGVTFNRDIAPILNANCVECHRSGEIAPMELTQYDEVVGWGQMILEVIDQKRMPPWHADPAFGHFVGERKMPAEARDMIAMWIDEGMPEGDPADLPSLPALSRGWHFPSEPSAKFAMREKPCTVRADGVVDYQYFVADPNWTEDRWIRAAQVLPGDPGVVHHAIVFVRPPDGSEFQGIGWLGAYVPGQRSVGLPPGHARRVPAGSKLIFQIHYTPNGRKTTDRTRVGVWEANADDVTHEVYTNIAIDQEFEIPPGAEEYPVEMSVDSFPPNSRMLGITPHMHLRGKSFLMEAVRSGGKKKTLLSVPRYDFNWQHWYEFANPVELDDVKSLQMKVTFDNSASNPFNPDHLKFVDWGDQTSDEMAMAFFDVAIPRGGAKHKTKEWRPLSDQEVASRKRQIDEHVEAFLGMMDSDKDGVVEREETPVTFQRYGFNRLDRNRDGRIDRAETEKNAAERL